MAIINQASKEDIQNIISGDTPAGKAVEATHAASADSATSATSATSAQTAQSAQTAASATKATQDGNGNDIAATYGKKPAFENKTIDAAAWEAVEGQSPYTHQASVEFTASLAGTNTILQLFNSDEALFDTYGFKIASATGQTAVIYSAGQPAEAVMLYFAIYNY